MPHHPLRRGRINTLWALLLGAAAAIVGLAALLWLGGPGRSEGTAHLLMYCAAGLRPPVEAVAQRYEREYGIRVELQFGGSNALLTQIDVDKFGTADLFLAGDASYTQLAREKGLAAECLAVAYQRPVLAVRKDRPRPIRSLDDLLADGVKVALADPQQAAVGRAVRTALQKITVGPTTRWQQLEQHVTQTGVFKPTVSDVATDVKLGTVDAGFVWDATVAMPGYRDVLQAVTLPELAGARDQVTVCVLHSTRQPTAALRFARYLTACDRGLPVFQECGLEPIDGDAWEERPEINFFCGAVNRRSVEPILADFQQREGVLVNTIYDGCGILTGRMKTITGQDPKQGFPDVYMACDVYYLENVKEWFQEAVDVSDTDIVIAVPKGSRKVTALADLVKPGIRVAVGQPEQCTIGALTRRLLAHEGLYEKLQEKQQQPGEVVVEKSSSALLVPDVLTGHVDAAVAYITDVMASRDRVDVVRIQSPLNVAVQPLSIARNSRHKHLVRRLFEKVAHSPQAFENAGFHFRLPPGEGQAVAEPAASPAGGERPPDAAPAGPQAGGTDAAEAPGS